MVVTVKLHLCGSHPFSISPWVSGRVGVLVVLVVIVLTLVKGCRILQHALRSCSGISTQQWTVHYLVAYGRCDVTALKSPKSAYHSSHSDSTRDCLQWPHGKYVVVSISAQSGRMQHLCGILVEVNFWSVPCGRNRAEVGANLAHFWLFCIFLWESRWLGIS